MQVIVEIYNLKKNLNGYRFFPDYTISQNSKQASFGKVNIIILKKSETGRKRAIDLQNYS